ncbi:1-(5-phosphoribosyl)-5-[(5-phosphoribosylamino)methylideneamino]imidazole-4-carboxamide isomerase [Brachyspira hyodysenteriae]|uniref:1-(5-phosphoribosyl)-5-[(5-phosphoribosylamino)methylideneamino] imidazole-4-carboxamide isomerase n=1 Tax=Brachyspira hyodysenteriae (strain ATCC 49526 / WA1) TaxID=565034 RepID=HIS4_BRAHW|nr:1-(5-phosphoribosyl)-5-[(5-phosphoribosylamino)methylideneamino]imidazole-4-carboxamide isomerase [Brachyspira hyodysenteriae]C0QWR6.1 RecName: Full=1-(5-phosphoribosyl)-5-[(5-phosphoribosylamino)methylideneamino] imidazole-4-carboxamide isomerase; AltName: Full=Phosphoribosylformimino-5-aminoimidazole carboxamide ribotide isomerase [Brachyspira hyodysenteriae WA1]ACN84719.1 phosphoribosylformimino-5-aminoimidazole carboxamide ribonucleotide (ProFAR) isomerase [Brachyspira hyodysenteriae WA1]
MYILPAIDLKNGEVVRLVEGNYDNKTTYFKDPLEVLDFFIESGSSYLHVVDLDGASDGETINFKTIEKVIKKCDLFVEVGGGIRNEDTIKKYLDIGVKRTILGTAAVENIDFTNNMINKYKEHIAVSIDSRDRMIAVKGWKEINKQDSVEFCMKLDSMGIDTIIYTDISKDGKLSGTNLDIYKELREKISCNIIASGGVTFEDEIIKLRDMKINGAIVGKAIYEGKIDLKKIIEIAKQ